MRKRELKERESKSPAHHRTGGRRERVDIPCRSESFGEGERQGRQLYLPHLPYAQVFPCFVIWLTDRWGLRSANVN
jgi:hypothetical protein